MGFLNYEFEGDIIGMIVFLKYGFVYRWNELKYCDKNLLLLLFIYL